MRVIDLDGGCMRTREAMFGHLCRQMRIDGRSCNNFDALADCVSEWIGPTHVRISYFTEFCMANPHGAKTLLCVLKDNGILVETDADNVQKSMGRSSDE